MHNQLEFIEDDELRETLASDLAEAYKTLGVGAYKAATVISGSAIECLLTYILSVSGESFDKVIAMDLGELIAGAKKKGILSSAHASACEAIRQHRNLIHPGRQVRIGEKPTESTARLAVDLLGIVIEGALRYCSEKTLSAGVLMRRVVLDPDAVVILRGRIQQATEEERLRLHHRMRDTILTGASWLTDETGQALSISERHEKLKGLRDVVNEYLDDSSKGMIESEAANLLDRWGEGFILFAHDVELINYLPDALRLTMIRYLCKKMKDQVATDPLTPRRIEVLFFLSVTATLDSETRRELVNAISMVVLLDARAESLNYASALFYTIPVDEQSGKELRGLIGMWLGWARSRGIDPGRLGKIAQDLHVQVNG